MAMPDIYRLGKQNPYIFRKREPEIVAEQSPRWGRVVLPGSHGGAIHGGFFFS